MKDVIHVKQGSALLQKTLDGKTLDLLFKGITIEGMIIKLDPASGFSETFKHKGEEVHFILEGEVEFTIGGISYFCSEGDVIWHNSDIEHTVKNVGSGPARYLSIMTPPAFM